MSEKDIFGFEMPPYLKRLAAEKDFRDGDPLAVDACVIACNEDGAAIGHTTVMPYDRWYNNRNSRARSANKQPRSYRTCNLYNEMLLGFGSNRLQ